MAAAPENSRGRWRASYELARTDLEHQGGRELVSATSRRWLDRQTRRRRADETDLEQNTLLDVLGVTSDSLTGAEVAFLAALDVWIAEHGHAEVPQIATVEVAGVPTWLGKRVSEARQSHRGGTLAAALRAELERRPGWTWRAREPRWEASWHARCDEIERHVAQRGSLRGLERRLSNWLSRQRLSYDDLTAPRARRLDRIPGALQARTSRVEAFVEAARRWLDGGPDGPGARTMAELRYADTTEDRTGRFPLGRRATYYRQRYHRLEGKHALSVAEQDAIEALPGWSWALGDRFRHPRAATPRHDSRPT